MPGHSECFQDGVLFESTAGLCDFRYLFHRRQIVNGKLRTEDLLNLPRLMRIPCSDRYGVASDQFCLVTVRSPPVPRYRCWILRTPSVVILTASRRISPTRYDVSVFVRSLDVASG